MQGDTSCPSTSGESTSGLAQSGRHAVRRTGRENSEENKATITWPETEGEIFSLEENRRHTSVFESLHVYNLHRYVSLHVASLHVYKLHRYMCTSCIAMCRYYIMMLFADTFAPHGAM